MKKRILMVALATVLTITTIPFHLDAAEFVSEEGMNEISIDRSVGDFATPEDMLVEEDKKELIENEEKINTETVETEAISEDGDEIEEQPEDDTQDFLLDIIAAEEETTDDLWEEVISDNDIDVHNYTFNDEENVGSVSYGSSYIVSNLPAKYDPRGTYITPINHGQGSTNMCTAFATANAMADCASKQGFENNKVAFSPMQLAYAQYKNLYNNGKYTGTFANYCMDGSVVDPLDVSGVYGYGPVYLSSAPTPYLVETETTKLQGTITTYRLNSSCLENYSLNDGITFNSRLYDVKSISGKMLVKDVDDISNTKSLIYTYGALAVTYHSSASAIKHVESTTADFNESASSGIHNHEVEIIGWDDNYDKNNFVKTPSQNGAWLLKGSWDYDHNGLGNGRGSGYYWLTYDAHISVDAAFQFYAKGSMPTDIRFTNVGNGKLKLHTGEAFALTYEIIPSTSILNDVVFTSADHALKQFSDKNHVDYVSNTGVIKCKKPIKDTVYCVTRDGIGENMGQRMEKNVRSYLSDTFLPHIATSVEIEVEQTKVEIANDSYTLSKSASMQLAPSLSFEYTSTPTYNYTSSDPSVASVNSRGVVEAKGFGKCDLTISTPDGYTEAKKVSIIVPYGAITSKDVKYTTVGVGLDNNIRAYDAFGNEIPRNLLSFTVANPSILGIYKETIDLYSYGTTAVTISFTDYDGKTYSATANVEVFDPKLFLAYNPNDGFISKTVDDTVNLYPTDEKGNTISVICSSSNENIASVTNDGIVTMKAPGEVNITVKRSDGLAEVVLVFVCTEKYVEPTPTTPGNDDDSNNSDTTPGYDNDNDYDDGSDNDDDGNDGNIGSDAPVIYNPNPVTPVNNKCVHTYQQVITKATTTKDGRIDNKCIKCNNIIDSKTFARAASVLTVTEKTYTGSKLKPTIKVYDANGGKLAASNYSAKYTNNKSVGIATITVTLKGNYTGTLSTTFQIIPKKASISSLKKDGTSLKVKYKKVADVTGYEIQYSTSKSFSASKTTTVKVSKATTVTKTIKSLKKGKTYYVRVRAYKKVGSTKITGKYSATKSVKI